MRRSEESGRKHTLDKDLDKLATVEQATSRVSRGLMAPGLALLFIVFCTVIAFEAGGSTLGAGITIAAAALAGYMALAIGANDVANNVSAAVGARALKIGSALALAAVFETAGALLAGERVVRTVSSGIIAQQSVADPSSFVLLMLSALLAAALWVHIATWIGAPVSTTHSIVGAVLGAGAATAGLSAIDWSTMAAIATSWVLSPITGGLAAIACLYVMKITVVYRMDKIAAARRWVPIHVAVMGGAFTAYIGDLLLPEQVADDAVALTSTALAVAGLCWLLSHLSIRRQAARPAQRNLSIRSLFQIPLIASAALLSFAHGANDVANAVAPLFAIVSAATGTGDASGVPPWIMLIGALGISFGLMLFGPRLVRMVGEQITKLNPVRGFCVALSVAVTVLFASAVGMPVSSTHITVGAVFGVGLFREWYNANSPRRRAYIAMRAERLRTERGSPAGKVRRQKVVPATEARRRRLVRRAHLATIVTAWIITVPLSGLLAALIFAGLNQFD